MSERKTDSQPRRRQRRDISRSTPDVEIQTGENPLPVDELIDQVLNSSKYRELFDVGFQDPQRRQHRFRNTLARATNSQVHDKVSWDEMQKAVKYFTEGLAIEPRLNIEVLGNLYIAERHALVRSTSSFLLGIDFNEEIIRQLEVGRSRALDSLTEQEVKELHLKFSQKIFRETLFGKTK